jgi:type I restriction enzyme S subunit
VELKRGTKQTEVGVIPEQWDVDNLERFWTVTDCKHVTARFVANGYPVASIMEVQSRFVDLTSANETTHEFYTLLIEGGRKPRAGDLILSRNATVGEVAQVAEWHPPFAMGQDVCLLRKRSARFSSNYLQSVFRSPIIENQLSDLMVGSTFKRVNVQQIRNLIVPMPPSVEQDAIAEALSDADDLIASLQELIAKNQQIKQGTTQELLTGKRRLPGFSENWKVKCLGDVFTISTGTSMSGYVERSGGRYWIVDMGSVSRDGRLIVSKGTNYQGDFLKVGDLVMPKDDIGGGNIIGKVAYIDADGKYVLGDHLYCLRAVEDNSLFLSYAINSYRTNNALRRKVIGSAQLGLGRRSVEEQEILLPLPSEQTAIAAILSDMDAEIAALDAKLAKTRALKQGMMQELLTGRIQLVAVQKATELELVHSG